jgi:hypothetical protein
VVYDCSIAGRWGRLRWYLFTVLWKPLGVDVDGVGCRACSSTNYLSAVCVSTWPRAHATASRFMFWNLVDAGRVAKPG